MTHKATRQLILTALFAAIIFLGVQFLKIEIAPKTMVHLGNALVVLSFFALGTKYSMLAASVGLGLYDITHGYADSVIFTVLESLIVLAVLAFEFKLMGKKENLLNVTLIGITAGIVKIIIIFIRRYITFALVSGVETAFGLTLVKMTNTFITSTFTAIAVPLLFLALRPVLKKLQEF